MKKILVTGGSGFLGSHLCKRLLNEDNHVLSIDNYFTSSKENIKDLLEKKNFKITPHDVSLPFHSEVDEIYNLACPASPIHYQKDPVQTTKVNVLGAINMLDLAKKTKAKIFQASTSEVYGDPKVSPQKEIYWGNVNPIGIRSCYDEGKRAAETLFFDYHRQHKIQIKIARIFNTYGPKMAINDGRVVSNFIIQCLRNNPITIYGEGSQTRSFCFVDDLIEGMVLLMNSKKTITGPINLGNPKEVTIKEIAFMIKDLTGSRSKISFHKLPLDDPMQRRPDITLAKEKLNWQPKTNLIEGLKKTINYFEKKL